MKKICFICFSLLIISSQHLSAQTILFVNINATGNNDGSSWTDAFTDLQAGIDAAASGDTIWVAAGTYSPSASSFTMKNGVVMLAGFNGTETSAAMRNRGINVTQLNANNNPAISNNNIDSTAVLDGFIFNGINNFNTNTTAIYNTSASPTITNCIFTGGLTDGGNGIAIDNENASSPRIMNCVFYSNQFVLGGGTAIENNASSPAFINCTFSSNMGGAIDNENNASPVITNCIFWNNSGNDIANDGSSTSNVTYSYSQTSIPGTGNIQGLVDPFIADNNPAGNDGLWMTADDGLFVYRVSASADGGTPDTTGLQLPSTDITGTSRIQGGAISAGAYETVGLKRVYINSSNPSGIFTGADWNTPLSDLQFAMDSAPAGDSIWVAQGSYYPDNVSFHMKNGLVVLGGFAGNETSASMRNRGINATNLNSIGNNIFNNNNVDSTAVLDGFTIQYVSISGDGAAMYNNTSSPTIRNCVFQQNSTSGNGGAMKNDNNSSPNIINCVFYNNNAGTNGGAVANNNSSSPKFINCTFSKNNASGTGGAIDNAQSCSPQIINCVFWDNTDNGGFADIHDDGTGNNNVSYSYTQTSIAGTGNITGTTNPFINDNNPSGNDGLWMTADDDMSINPLSTAANSGSNSALPVDITTDITGNPRIKTGTVDMGAYETTPVTRIYVNGNNGSGLYTGLDWNSALTDLQQALNLAIAGDTIWVQYGTYQASPAYTMKNGVKLLGGFGGYETDLSQRNTGNYQTILQGKNGNAVYNDHTNNTTVIDGFIIQSSDESGIFNSFSSPQIRNCVFDANNSDSSGAGIYNAASSPFIVNCVFNQNHATTNGGAIENNWASSPIITNCTFNNNSANGTGGGISNENNSSATITNCIFWNNTADINNDGSSASNVTYSFTQAAVSGTGNITGSSTPFVNDAQPAGNDGGWMTADDGLNVLSSSPVINAGTPDTSGLRIPVTDIMGQPRIGGTAIEMGAYELTLTQLYVDSANISGTHDGLSWATAFTDPQDAFNAISPGGTIWVAKGTYQPSSGNSFNMLREALLYGGFVSGGYNFSDRNWGTNPTVFSGNGNSVLKLTNIRNNAVIDGFNIINGNAVNGGGLLLNNAASSIKNCAFVGNTASASGAGIYNGNASTPSISNCIFVNNIAITNGGAIDNNASSPNIFNCTFNANTAATGSGIYSENNSSPTIQDNVLWGNSGTNDVANDATGTTTFNYNSDKSSISGTANFVISTSPFINESSPAGADGLWMTADDGIALTPTANPVDAGNAGLASLLNIDITGAPRPQGNIDMGAYETTFAITRIYVDSSNINNGQNGRSWATAFTDFQSALNMAVAGDTIWVAKGTYLPQLNTAYPIKDGIKIYGGFSGNETTIAARNYNLYHSVLMGNNYSVVTTTNVSNSTRLDGLIFRKGDILNSTSSPVYINCSFDSSSMDNFGSSPAITNCNFYNSSGFFISNYSFGIPSAPAITNCTFTNCPNNIAVYNYDNTAAVITNCTFTNNGGIVYNNHSSSIITNCTFSNNSNTGGFINENNASPVIKHCTFDNVNEAIANYNSSPSISECIFKNNRFNGIGAGGVYNSNHTNATLINCIFYNNGANGIAGGALFNNNSSSTMTNCVFSNNAALGGLCAGVMWNEWNSNATFINCTFGDNVDSVNSYYVAGILNQYYSNLTISNSVFWGNEAIDGTLAEIKNTNNPGTTSITYSYMQDSYSGTGNIQGNSNPFVNDADPVGADGKLGTGDDGLELLSTSSAINAGSNALVPLSDTVDVTSAQRRIFNSIVDIGAYEYPPVIILPITLVALNGNAINNSSAILNWKTTSEINTSYFMIERSEDGKQFVAVGSIMAIGAGSNSYEYTDVEPLQTGYYRLRMVDKNGVTTYSNIIQIKLQQFASLNIFPNPARDYVTITTNNNKLIGTTALLLNAEGKALQKIEISGSQTISLSRYAQGTYFLRLINGETHRIIIGH